MGWIVINQLMELKDLAFFFQVFQVFTKKKEKKVQLPDKTWASTLCLQRP